MKKILFRLILLVVVLGAAWAGYSVIQQMPQRQQQAPTTRVRRGDVIVKSYSRGELRAVRSVTLTAPNLFGTVQVTRLAALGSFAREKDLVVEFDDAEVLSRMEDKQIEIDQTDEQIKKAQADLAIRNNQDQVELLRARYAVRRAELEVKRNELVSEIDAKKNLLSLEEARRRLKQLESDIKSRQEQAEAELAVLRERRNKAVMELNRERMRLSQVKLLAPMSGLVAIRQNRSGFTMFGMPVPDIREGDQIQPGMPVADVLDLSEMEVLARVGELDRANLHEGQEVILRLDAIPEKEFTGRIKSMSSTASANMFSSDPAKKFDVVFSIDMRQLLSSLGANEQQIAKILATAEQNRKKPGISSAASPMMAMGGMPFGMPGGGAGGAMMMGMGGGGGAPGGFGGSREGGRGAGGAGGGGMGAMMGGNLSDEDRQKMREAFQKALGGRQMSDLSQEERQKIFEEMRRQVPAAAAAGTGAAAGAGTRGGARGPGGNRGQGGGAEGAGAEQRMRPGFGGPGGGGRGGPGGGPGGFVGPQGFTQKDLAEAKLPPAPEEDSQLDVLLRPGLLADVEIIVDKAPDALYLPNQAVFEREGKLVVFVRNGNQFEAREIRAIKRSETTTIIAEGVEEDEIVALSDPDAKPGEGKKGQEKSGPPMGMPGGSEAGGGRRGGR
ncbi:MAG: efflux RND transporter periplasmic adaptor subunit [Bryobacteraceae bacterium]